MGSKPHTGVPEHNTIVVPTRVSPQLSTLLANGVLALLLLTGRLSGYDLVFIFWLELGVIGLGALARLIVAALFGQPFETRWSTATRGATLLFAALAGVFFCMKFGAVLLGIFLVLMTLPMESGFSDFSPVDWGPWVELSLGFLLLSHAYAFVANFLLRGGYRTVRIVWLLVYPYARGLWILAATGAAFALATSTTDSQPTALFGLGLLAVKTLCDFLCLAWAERR